MKGLLTITFCLLVALTYTCNLSPNDDSIQHTLSALSTNSSCLEDCCATLEPRAPNTYYYYQNTGRFRGGSG